METLKAAIPESLKRMIGESCCEDLLRTCSSIHHFLLHFEPFHQIVSDLADPKNALCGKSKDAAMESKKLGNQYFMSGDYNKALDCYTQALRMAPFEAGDLEKNMVTMLYVNRATVLHKMNLSIESLRDCNRALQICPSYAKAWYRRGMVNASLGYYKDANCDLNMAKSVELSLGGKKQIENELKKILDQCEGKISVVQHKKDSRNTVDEMPHIELQCVTTLDKGRGMTSSCDIAPTSLVHIEEPYAMIILKQCRETHCHYCLNDLPVDRVPCRSCSVPLYCSQRCQMQAGGQTFTVYPHDHGILKNLQSDLREYVSEIILANDSEPKTEDFPEHRHECQGVNWPAVLPSDIVLAGRVLAKFLQKSASKDTNIAERLDFSHCYTQMPSESKLELHIYAIVLLYCLPHSYGVVFPIDGVTMSQVVLILSQIKVNCMTLVRMKSVDAHGLPHQFGESPSRAMSNVEQVRVGKAIYKAGRLFNHSCQPNIFAYFMSRTLFLRTTKFVTAGCHLELSYGPQVGLWDCKDRISFLKDEYAFECRCSGCSEYNLSDVVLKAFHCVNPNCSGIVLERRIVDCEKQKIKQLPSAEKVNKNDEFYEVYLNRFDKHDGSIQIQPGYCSTCSSYCDLESSHAAVDKAWISIQRLQDAIMSKEITDITISDALKSLRLLRLKLHPYNRRIAEAEDNLAQAFCFLGELNLAVNHCKASIQILEKLYGPDDIVIAYELVKLCSIQLSLGDATALDSINRMDNIFSRYYGLHSNLVFPYLQYLRREIKNFSEKRLQSNASPTK